VINHDVAGLFLDFFKFFLKIVFVQNLLGVLVAGAPVAAGCDLVSDTPLNCSIKFVPSPSLNIQKNLSYFSI
jgi:hypothetical protein